jgi:hypothetical protein
MLPSQFSLEDCASLACKIAMVKATMLIEFPSILTFYIVTDSDTILHFKHRRTD